MESHFRACWFLLLAIVCSTFQPAVSPADDGPTFLLANEGRLQPSDYTLKDLDKLLSSFKHAPLNTAGFNAMVMPIHYEDPDGLGDPDEAYAFSFLLSNALDWAPGSYCMRHAFFVYSQSPDLMKSLASKYTPERVGKAVRLWKATHGVGGTLVKSKRGYSGTLEIFGTDGKQLDHESFDDPRPYFDLLGDMSAAAMKFLGEPANDALVQYLKIPRCKDMKTVAQLGSMAYMDRQTMLNTVDQILQKDPGFSEVRSWASQQRFWSDGDQARSTREKKTALQDYLSAEALRVYIFDYANAQDIPRTTWQSWWQQVEKMCPEDSPLLVMRGIWSPEQQFPALMKHTTQILASAAAKYPNNYYLMTYGAAPYLGPNMGSFDINTAAGMCITALQSNFMTADGSKPEAISLLVRIADALGRPDIVVQLASSQGQGIDPEVAATMLDAFCDLGQFEMARKFYSLNPPFPPQDRGGNVIRAIDAAAMLHHVDEVDNLVNSEKMALYMSGQLRIAKAYQDCLHGREVDIAKLESQTTELSARTQMFLLAGQLDLAAGGEKLRSSLWRETALQPDARPFIVLLNAYDRKNPRPEMVNLYRTIDWLFPDDSYLVKAAAEGMGRHAGAPQPDVARVQKALKIYPPHARTYNQPLEDREQVNSVRQQITPWDVAAAVRSLTEQSKFQDAIDLAWKYTNFVSGTGDANFFWPCHLAHLVEMHRDSPKEEN